MTTEVKRVPLRLNIPESLDAQIRRIAVQNNISRATVIKAAIELLQKHGAKIDIKA